eukprot:Nk52_evm6s361 gene=Nk52_evmTU6s361
MKSKVKSKSKKVKKEIGRGGGGGSGRGEAVEEEPCLLKGTTGGGLIKGNKKGNDTGKVNNEEKCGKNGKKKELIMDSRPKNQIVVTARGKIQNFVRYGLSLISVSSSGDTEMDEEDGEGSSAGGGNQKKEKKKKKKKGGEGDNQVEEKGAEESESERTMRPLFDRIEIIGSGKEIHKAVSVCEIIKRVYLKSHQRLKGSATGLDGEKEDKDADSSMRGDSNQEAKTAVLHQVNSLFYETKTELWAAASDSQKTKAKSASAGAAVDVDSSGGYVKIDEQQLMMRTGGGKAGKVEGSLKRKRVRSSNSIGKEVGEREEAEEEDKNVPDAVEVTRRVPCLKMILSLSPPEEWETLDGYQRIE